MKRIVLFLATNIAVMVVLTFTTQILGLDRWLLQNGINYAQLLVFAAIFGFGGAIVSLLISKPMAKFAAGVQVIDAPATADEQWLVSTVAELAKRAGIGMPEVGVFAGAPTRSRPAPSVIPRWWRFRPDSSNR
jgi:heat shock protein HtpX